MSSQNHNVIHLGLLAAFAAIAAPADAITVDINDGSTYTLSAAVTEAYAAEDGPDIININVASLATADGQILLDKPITINGNANARLSPDDKCDILVDMANIQLAATADVGQVGKAYLEISSPGDVNINNLKIHPNLMGKFGAAAVTSTIVAGIRMWNPVSGVGNYNFTGVLVSGSKGATNTFMPLDDGTDLYSPANAKKWGGFNGAQHVNVILYGTIQADNGTGAGTFNILLDHCNAGLGFGAALNINSTGGTTLIKGGVYGHCGRDGIRVASTNVTLQGTAEDRLRVVRPTNISGGNSHGVEVAGNVTLMEYVDVAGLQTANSFSFQSGTINMMRFCRALGKMDGGLNETVYITGANTDLQNVENCTFVGSGSNGNPMNITSNVDSPVAFKDCIFTSEIASATSGSVILASTGGLTFTNCALPTDGTTSESLRVPPVTGAAAATAVFTPPIDQAPYNLSPNYMLTRASYDWSNNQGAGQPGNAVGNANVLRPQNPAYQTASSTGGALNGGAGAPAAGIDASEWMLMQ